MSASDSPPCAGVRLLGARGPATTALAVLAGRAARTAGPHPPTGPVTETPPFPESGLPGQSAPVLGLRSPQPSPPWQHASRER
jgi:myo-inositol-1-phosphate synthase